MRNNNHFNRDKLRQQQERKGHEGGDRSPERSSKKRPRTVRGGANNQQPQPPQGGDRSPERSSKKRKYKFWDVPPSGYEHMTPKEYKELQGGLICCWYRVSRLFFSPFSHWPNPPFHSAVVGAGRWPISYVSVSPSLCWQHPFWLQ